MYISPVKNEYSEHELEENPEKFNWLEICMNKELPISFYEKFEKYIRWDIVSRFQVIDVNMIRLYENKINWHQVRDNLILSNVELTEVKNKQTWEIISEKIKLNQRSLLKYRNKLNWEKVLFENTKTKITDKVLNECKEIIYPLLIGYYFNNKRFKRFKRIY